MSAIPKGPWAAPKPPLCTSSAPGPSTRGSPLLFRTNAEAGSPCSCSTAHAEGCSCRTHGQAWWPKDGEDILGWAQPRGQILHPSPGRGQGQCTRHSRARIGPCAGAIWAAKLPLLHPPPGTTKRDAVKDGFGWCHRQGMLCQALQQSRGAAGTPPAPSPAPQASRAQPAADRG